MQIRFEEECLKLKAESDEETRALQAFWESLEESGENVECAISDHGDQPCFFFLRPAWRVRANCEPPRAHGGAQTAGAVGAHPQGHCASAPGARLRAGFARRDKVKITIESTTKIVKADGIDCRVWEGKTERGVEIVCLIPRIAVRNGQDTSQFETELPAVVKKNTKTPGQSTSRLVPRTPARKYHCQ